MPPKGRMRCRRAAAQAHYLSPTGIVSRPQAVSPNTPAASAATYHCGASHRNGRDLIIATRPAHQPLSSHCISGSRRRGYFAPRRERFLCLRRPHFFQQRKKWGKNAGRNYVSALPQRAMPVRCRPRFPSRNRRFPDRCRSPDCASTAFRCRCLLLRQKLSFCRVAG